MPTVLLCHCNGTNGSTTFTDVSPSVHTLTSVSSATVSTSIVKFGSGSANHTSSNSARIEISGTLGDFDFQSGQFTIEMWAYHTSAPSIASLFAQFNNSAGGGWFFGSVSGTFAFWHYNGAGTQVTYNTGSVFPATGAWHHYCADRDAGGTLRLYIDGVVKGSTSAPTFQTTASLRTNIGNSNRNTDGWPGYIDDVRITKGQALYAGAFTPPTAEFPDGAATAQARAIVLA